MSKKLKSQPAVSLVLVVLILGSILAAGLMLSETLVRQGQVSRAISLSELAYYAAESGMEAAAYKINKEGANPLTLSVFNSLPNNSFYNLEGKNIIYNTAPWQVSLTNQSFQLDLNLNIAYPASLPASLSVNAPPLTNGEVILFSWQRAGGGEIDFINNVPPLVTYDINTDRYYQLKIRNPDTSSVTFTINVSSSASPIPSGFELEISGFFKNFQRKIKTFFPKFFFY